jgi:hypothetical protein
MVDFNVPDDAAHTLEWISAGQIKFAIITGSMRRALEDAARGKQGREAFRLLTEGRSERPALSDDDLYQLPGKGRH